MRRITIWLTTALAIAAMAFYYDLSLSGDGKDGDGGQGPPIEQSGKPGESK